MSALDELGEKTHKQEPDMTALEWLIWNNRNAPIAQAAAAELAALVAERDGWKMAYMSLEFDETTGGCLLGCGGDSVEGHNDGCLFVENLPERMTK